ncbi:hypothetical protein QR680_017051 [Steinernema hermaphroditum]|uniref:Sphingomyelin synthase-like domain-containing protein n=1 Tax=Steinernema hermaphroditum TaxID=289476 RepID=A0AA39LNM5_9BILA|nr:hypothetical protein QR680_017051 [Steinernema hermaphroditum]
MIFVFLDFDRPLRPLRCRHVFDYWLLIRFAPLTLLLTATRAGARETEQLELVCSPSPNSETNHGRSIASFSNRRRYFDGRYVMGGHRRDQSESHMPLRESDFQMSVDGNGQELQVRVVNEELSVIPIVIGGSAIANGSANVSAAYADPCDPAPHDGPPARGRLRSEILKTFVAFVCLMMSAFLNFFLLTVIHDIIPTKPLPDLVFMLIPQQRWAWAVGDVLSTVSSVVGFAVILLHKDRLIVLRRVLLLGAIMYGLRAVVMGVTFLPTSFANREEICLPQVNRTAMYATEIATRFLTYVVTLGLTSGQDKILCGDLMFSGHTVVLTIMYFTQLQYTPRGLVILRYIATPITFLGIAALVVSGGHYSMDVLIAYWLTSHVFWSYHQIFSMPRAERPNAPLSRVWWFWLCYWFEADVPEGPIVNEWNWPLPYPTVAHRWVALLNAKLQ